MTPGCSVVLADWQLPVRLGHYGPNDTVPRAHLLDLTLHLDPGLVLVGQDGMAHVFDYDPLLAELERLATDGHYDTQEWLLSRMAQACAAYPAVEALDIALRKTPLRGGTGSLGVRLCLDAPALAHLRAQMASMPTHHSPDTSFMTPPARG